MRNATNEPGLFINRIVPVGNAYVMDIPALTFGEAGTRRGIAMNPKDWARLALPQQEAFREYMVWHSAEDGLRALQHMLNVVSSEAARDAGGQGE